jgi:Na+-translocating ferredoxin:NAD+ oxidoreductase RNF subunit RnfB
VQEALPGANCGGCGFSGCAAYASAIVEKGAPVNNCSVGGKETAESIAVIMGVTAGEVTRKNAVVRCCGVTGKIRTKYEYQGNMTCEEATRLSGGYKSCLYSCIGYGSCAAVCPVNAISVIDEIARIDKEKCISCGKCVLTCPKHLIELMPYNGTYFVGCMSEDKGAKTKANCDAGCIGCKLCERACKYDAIHVVNSKASIEYEKCTNCGECAKVCPQKIIRVNGSIEQADNDAGKITDGKTVDKLIKDAGQKE